MPKVIHTIKQIDCPPPTGKKSRYDKPGVLKRKANNPRHPHHTVYTDPIDPLDYEEVQLAAALAATGEPLHVEPSMLPVDHCDTVQSLDHPATPAIFKKEKRDSAKRKAEEKEKRQEAEAAAHVVTGMRFIVNGIPLVITRHALYGSIVQLPGCKSLRLDEALQAYPQGILKDFGY